MDVDAEDLNIRDTKIQACCGYFRRPERERLYRIIGFLRIDFNILDVLKETDRTGNICLGDSILRQRQNKGHVVYVWFSETESDQREKDSMVLAVHRFCYSRLFRERKKRGHKAIEYGFKVEAEQKDICSLHIFLNQMRTSNMSVRSRSF